MTKYSGHLTVNGKVLCSFEAGQLGAVLGAPDFIGYLNNCAFPEYESKLIRGLGCYDYEIPAEYQGCPLYDFQKHPKFVFVADRNVFVDTCSFVALKKATKPNVDFEPPYAAVSA